MWPIDCPETGRRIIGPRQVLGTRNHHGLIDVALRCHCGGVALWRTGRAAHHDGMVAHLDASAAM